MRTSTLDEYIAKLIELDIGDKVELALPMYTFGPPLRTPNVKNLGKDLAPEQLRTCPWIVGTRKFFGFSGAITSNPLKNRAARATR